jgi:hypothetical protein
MHGRIRHGVISQGIVLFITTAVRTSSGFEVNFCNPIHNEKYPILIREAFYLTFFFSNSYAQY